MAVTSRLARDGAVGDLGGPVGGAGQLAKQRLLRLLGGRLGGAWSGLGRRDDGLGRLGWLAPTALRPRPSRRSARHLFRSL